MEIFSERIKREMGVMMTIFLHNRVYKGGENPARVLRQKVAINLYREVAYQGRCFDRTCGYRLSYREACIPCPLYNNARDGITADCSRYPPTVIRMQNHNRACRHIRVPHTTNNIK